jgi:hypothetical protein
MPDAKLRGKNRIHKAWMPLSSRELLLQTIFFHATFSLLIASLPVYCHEKED